MSALPGMLAVTMLEAIGRGTIAVPLLWVIGVVLLVAGVVALFRGSVVVGVILILLGIFLGALNVL